MYKQVWNQAITLKHICDRDQKADLKSKAMHHLVLSPWCIMGHWRSWKAALPMSHLSSSGSLRLTSIQYETFPPQGWEEAVREGGRSRRANYTWERGQTNTESQHIITKVSMKTYMNTIYKVTGRLIWASLPSTLSGLKLILILKALYAFLMVGRMRYDSGSWAKYGITLSENEANSVIVKHGRLLKQCCGLVSADWPWTWSVVKASTFPCLLEAVHTYVPESSWVTWGTVSTLMSWKHLGGSSPSN